MAIDREDVEILVIDFFWGYDNRYPSEQAMAAAARLLRQVALVVGEDTTVDEIVDAGFPRPLYYSTNQLHKAKQLVARVAEKSGVEYDPHLVYVS